MFSFLVGVNIVFWHFEFSNFLYSWVVWPYCCHLLPPETYFYILPLQTLSHISEVVLNPLVLKIYLVKLCCLSQNSLIPNCYLIVFTLFSFKFTDNTSKYYVCIPVNKSTDVCFEVKLKDSNLFIVVLVINETIHIGHTETGVFNRMRSPSAVQVVKCTHKDHTNHHVVPNHIESPGKRIHLS